jgi:hypothetical protein
MGVEVTETINHIGYEVKPVGTWMGADVFRELSTFHPSGYEL